MQEVANEQSRLIKQIGGALFGMCLSIVIAGSIEAGATYFFPEEANEWGLAFWGSHHILRIIASLIGTLLGGFAAGCIAKLHGRMWGLLSALPTSLFWLFDCFMLVKTLSGDNLIQVTLGNWVVVFVLTLMSPIVGYCSGSIGGIIRVDNPQIFESRSGTILGVKWYQWIWLAFSIHWVGLLTTFSIFQGLIILSGNDQLVFSINPVIAIFLVVICLCFIWVGIYKIFYFLISGKIKGLTNGQIVFRVFGWNLVILVVTGIFQTLTGFIMK
jgi:hypothetical protein